MPITASPYFIDPHMGQITSNLATAIYGDPSARMKRDLYAAEAERNYALTGKTDEETRGLRTKNDAMDQYPSAVSKIFAPLQPGETLQSRLQAVAPLIGQIGVAGGGNADQMANGLQGNLSNVFTSLGGDDDMRRGLVIQGKTPGKDFAGTAARADQVAGRDAGFDFKKDTAVAGIHEAGATGRERIQESGRNTRFYDTPLTAAPGNKIFLSPTDPRSKTMGTNGVLEGNTTKATAEGAAGNKILALPDNAPVPSNIAGVFTGKLGDGAAGKPKAVSGKKIDDAILAGARAINGAVDMTNPAKPMLKADFEKSFNDPARVANARAAASAELAKSGNADLAGKAYLAALGLKPGDTFEKVGGFMGMGGHNTVTGSAPAASPIAQAVTPPAPAQPGAIPPPDKRPLGMKATGRDGVVRQWTQQGWVAAQPEGPVY